MQNKTILIFGGSGSLGHKLIDRYLENNIINVYSRDECKHWKMSIHYKKHPNLHFIIGDIRDFMKVNQSILRVDPDIIIIASALKHIDRCEYETNECISTNLLGTQNILNSIELLQNNIKLEKVCFVSTDKACSSVNIYGMCKAVSECLMIEKSKFIKNIKFVTVRYGNVLNSRGSIIPKLHEIGQNNEYHKYTVTDDRMTRFVMTLNQSVDLIQHALDYGESGDVVIPKLISCKIIDLIKIFSEKYNKPIEKGELRPGEKLLESLINETQSMRLIKGKDGYMFIKPPYKNIMVDSDVKDYNSKLNPLSKEDLKKYLLELNLL
jgi:UDP-N-acetylglucosamine 4,6-dehydratase/5-epimerase